MTKVICVDLDGTLIYNDVSVESAKRFAATGILNIFKLLKWIFRGVPYTKCRIAELQRINPEELSYNFKLIEYLKQKKQEGYSVFLATGSTKIYAEAIAKHLNIFDGVFASDENTNLVGEAKAEKLSKTFGEFTYFGNSIDDIPVWEKSAKSVIVNPSKGVLEKMKNKEYQLFE